MIVRRDDVMDASNYFPIEYDKFLELVNKSSKRFYAFNGKVFDKQRKYKEFHYRNGICEIEETDGEGFNYINEEESNMKETYLDLDAMNEFINAKMGIIADIEQSKIVEDFCRRKGIKEIGHMHTTPDYSDRCLIYRLAATGTIMFVHYNHVKQIDFSEYCMVVCGFNSIMKNNLSCDIDIPRELCTLEISDDKIKNGLKNIINEYVKISQCEPYYKNTFANALYANVLEYFGIRVSELNRLIDKIEITK